MNLIPRKYDPTYYGWFLSDWTARTVGGMETKGMLTWSRKTYGLDRTIWIESGWFFWYFWHDTKDGISDPTYTRVFPNPQR